MKVAITGATGFIGRHLTANLIEHGHEVIALVRTPDHGIASHTGLTVCPIGATGEGLEGVMDAGHPEVVVHLAAHYVAEHVPQDIPALIDGNLGFGTRVLESMANSGCHHLVTLGSCWQFGDAPVNLYAALKNAFIDVAAFYRSAHGLRVVELALYDSYGPGDPRAKLIPLLLRAATTGQILDLSPGEQRLHLVHIQDLCRAIELAAVRLQDAGSGDHETYRLPSAQAHTLRDIVACFNAVGPQDQPANVRWGARPYRDREVMHPWEDGPILPGWQPAIPLDEGLRDVRKHYAGTMTRSP